MDDYFPIAPYIHADTVSSAIKDVVFGRNVACRQIIQAFSENIKQDEQIGYYLEWKLTGDPLKAFKDIWGDKDLENIQSKMRYFGEFSELRSDYIECVLIFDPNIDNIARCRLLNSQQKEFSILGLVHSLHTLTSHQRIRSLITGNLMPWDALICTSSDSKQLVDKIMHVQAEEIFRKFYLSKHQQLEFQKKIPQTPLIPLAGPSDIDCQSGKLLESRDRIKRAARRSLNIPISSFVMVSVGRLSHITKSNPSILFSTLEKLALKYRRNKFILILAGAFDGQYSMKCYEELYEICKQFQIIILGGTRPITDIEMQKAIRASDIFISMADNPQETFGLSLLNALVEGTPIIASKWSGYKDIVEHGVNGYLINTSTFSFAESNYSLPRSLYLTSEVDDSIYSYLESMQVIVDPGHLFACLEKLFLSPSLCEKFVHNGYQIYNEKFSPKSVVNKYRDLAYRLTEIRQAFANRTEKPFVNNQVEPNHIYPVKRIEISNTTIARTSAETLRNLDFLKLEINSMALEVIGFRGLEKLILLLKESKLITINHVNSICLDYAQARYIFVTLLKLGILEL